MAAFAGVLAFVAAELNPLGQPNANASTPTSSLSLVQESNWTTSSSGFHLTLRVKAPVASGDLVLRAQLYPRMLSRYALEHQPLEGGPTETLNNISLNTRVTTKTTNAQSAPIQFRIVTQNGSVGGPASARELHLDCLNNTCDGVYPIVLTLFDRAGRRSLASLTTSLVYVGSVGTTRRLNVALTLPLDVPPSLTGRTALTVAQTTEITDVADAISGYSTDSLSLMVYGRLITQLKSDATPGQPDSAAAAAALSSLARLAARSNNIEFLRTPYAPIDLNSLVRGSGISTARSEFNGQLLATFETTAKNLHTNPQSSPYLSPYPLDPSSASLVADTGVCELAVPLSNVSLNVGDQSAEAPFAFSNTSLTSNTPLSCSSRSEVGVAIDPGFSSAFGTDALTPQLAAHQLLADLAQTYFENPNALASRSVVISPNTWLANGVFMTTLLSGLRSNPILRSVTLSELFNNVAIGANGAPTSAALQNVNSNDPIGATALKQAYADLRTVQTTTPTDTSLFSTLAENIYDGESYGLQPRQRSYYLRAPKRAIAAIANALQLSGSSHVTFTAASGKIPITIHYTGPVLPVKVDLRILSSRVDFPSSEARQHLSLTLRDTNEILKVSTRTSGLYTFDVELLVPHQSTVLLGPTRFTITSTAASGEAIGLSLAALFVLAWWWSRSIRRHRREKLAKGAVHTGESGPITS